MEEMRLLREEQVIAENERKETLRAMLGNAVPNRFEKYPFYCQTYLANNEGSTEWNYLKILLQFFKLQFKNKKLPAAFFTVSKRGQLCSVETLKEKLFRVME